MSLGYNDALGFPARSKGGSKIIVGRNYTAATAFVNVAFLTYTQGAVDWSDSGDVEYVKDTYLGDKFTVKRAGLYRITATGGGTGTPYQAIMKNWPGNAVEPAALSTTLFVPANKPHILACTRITANLVANQCWVGWLDSGDYVQVLQDITGAQQADGQYFEIERLGG